MAPVGVGPHPASAECRARFDIVNGGDGLEPARPIFDVEYRFMVGALWPTGVPDTGRHHRDATDMRTRSALARDVRDPRSPPSCGLPRRCSCCFGLRIPTRVRAKMWSSTRRRATLSVAWLLRRLLV